MPKPGRNVLTKLFNDDKISPNYEKTLATAGMPEITKDTNLGGYTTIVFLSIFKFQSFNFLQNWKMLSKSIEFN